MKKNEKEVYELKNVTKNHIKTSTSTKIIKPELSDARNFNRKGSS